MKKILLFIVIAIALIACKPNGQEPQPTNYTKAYLVGLKVMSVQYSGYTYWFEILDQSGKAVDAAGTATVYNASCPVNFKLLSPKRLDVTSDLYHVKMIAQEGPGKVPFTIFSDGEISVFPMLKYLDYPDVMTFCNDDYGNTVLAIYEYE